MMHRKQRLTGIGGTLVLVVALLAGCGPTASEGTAVPTPTAVPEGSATLTPTATPVPLGSPTPAPTPTSAPQAQARSGGKVRLASSAGVGWDPDTTTSAPHWWVSFVYSKLMQLPYGGVYATTDLTPALDLAESWEMPSDRTYVFKLRKGIKFHNKPPVNGRELTSQDVKWSMERKMVAGLALGPVLKESVESIETPDNYTVKFILKEP
ncbi:MAG: hypothetical protein HYX99_02995, partial [Chloroflexi bacterium]|nr:hypothetical protein [Chloroflexota bacterium]